MAQFPEPESDHVFAVGKTWLNHLDPELPVLRLIQLTESFKSHVIDTD
jgi:hypothetical protein